MPVVPLEVNLDALGHQGKSISSYAALSNELAQQIAI